MPLISQNATLDGIADFTLFGSTFSSVNGNPGLVRRDGGDAPDMFQADLTFSGSWEIEMPQFAGAQTGAVIIDTSDGGFREIELIHLGSGGNLTLTHRLWT